MAASDTRRRVLDEFANQLLERGYLGVSLDQIATRVEIKKPSLYHHFPGGKEEMYSAVADRYIECNGELLRAALATAGELVDRLEAVVRIYAAPEHHATMGQRLFDATRYLSDDARSRVSHRYVETLIAPVVAVMAQAVDRGELRAADPGFLASAFLEMAAVAEPMPEDVAMPAEERGDPTVDPTLPRAVAELFLNGAAADGTIAG